MQEDHIAILSEKIKDKIRKYQGKINQCGMEESVIETMKAYFEKRNLQIVEKNNPTLQIERVCKCGCGKSIKHKHVNARFLSQKHKDNYWNGVNPRGIHSHRNIDSDNFDPEWDRHPFDIDQD